MPGFHCIDCHHEWEGSHDRFKCDWCGSNGVIIEQKTALERSMADPRTREWIDKWVAEMRQRKKKELKDAFKD